MIEKVRIATGLDGAASATGEVVVFDVLRAFTTAAHALDAGLAEIDVVASVEDAFARPGFRFGEVGGRLVPGFDHDNSPSRLVGKKLSGPGVLRTTSGARGVVAATRATGLWAASLVVASATARALAGAVQVTLVAMGAPDEPAEEEDLAAAEVVRAMLLGERPDFERAVATIRASRAAARHDGSDPHRPIEDVDRACQTDAFDFAMKVDRVGSRLVLRKS